jgi:hypothetical protein
MFEPLQFHPVCIVDSDLYYDGWRLTGNECWALTSTTAARMVAQRDVIIYVTVTEYRMHSPTR